MTPSSIRTGLAAAVDTISGLRCFDYVPDSLSVPAAVVEPIEITFDESMVRGSDFYRAFILVIVGRMSDRSSQDRLDTYIPAVKSAVEADRTLGGRCSTLRVTSALPREVVVSSVNMIAYRFEVDIYG